MIRTPHHFVCFLIASYAGILALPTRPACAQVERSRNAEFQRWLEASFCGRTTAGLSSSVPYGPMMWVGTDETSCMSFIRWHLAD